MSTIIEKDIVIIGAGLTGLTTAFYLKRKNADFLVIEKNSRAGGVINTETEKGYLLETGPNTGVIGNPDVAELFEDLGDSCQIEIPGKTVNKRYILKNGKWEAIPSGLWGGITTPLFTTKDKFRLLGEPFRARGKNPDENLSSMVIRRLGKSILDYVVDPFILGVYSGDPSYLIPRYALPKLYKLEQDYGSFIGGSIKKSFKKKDPRELKATRKVFGVKGGLSNLTNALYKQAGNGNFVLGTSSLNIDYKEGKYISSFIDSTGKELKVKSHKLVTTSGAFTLNNFIGFIPEEELTPITNLLYANVVEVVLGFDNWEGFNPDGFGGLIPFIEHRDVLGILFMSTLFANRTPENGTLFTMFLGGIRKSEFFSKSEEQVKEIVEKEFINLMKPKTFNPTLFKVFFHKGAIPQYGIESGKRFEQVGKLEKKYPGLILGGNLKDGIGMADRIKQGKSMADRLNNL